MIDPTPTANAKTVLAPCMGVGKIVASVTRRAAYLVKGQCPEDVELLSIPALLAGDPHERALLQNHPSIVIDGCALRCAAHIYRLYGVEPAAKIEVNQVMKEKKIGPGKTRKELENVGKRLADFTAERVLLALNDEGIEAAFVAPDDLSQPSPDAGIGCPHRDLSHLKIEQTGMSTPPKEMSARPKQAIAPLDTISTAEPKTENHKPETAVRAVTVIPCQGIKRTGGRITQRAAYDVVEDRFLGKSQVLCISALAGGVQEDIEMFENYPSVAVNGCGLRCASIAAEHHGIPAVAHVDLHLLDPEYKGDEFCYEPDLTERELLESKKLADAVSVEVEKLLSSDLAWQRSKVDLHGMVVEPGRINALTGYADNGQGILVQLAKRSAGILPASPSVPVSQSVAPSTLPAETGAHCTDYPGLKNVVATMFKPKPKSESV